MPVDNPPHPPGLASRRTEDAPECPNLLCSKSSNASSGNGLNALQQTKAEEISSNTQTKLEGLEWTKQRVAEIKAIQDDKREAQQDAWEQL